MIQAAYPVTKSGNGEMELTGVNTYSGSTAVTAGTLQVGNGATGSLSTTSTISVSNNALLAYNIGTAQTYSGPIIGAGAVNFRGGSTLTVLGTNTFSGGLTIAGGTLGLGVFDAGNEKTQSLGTGTVGISGGVLTLGGTYGSSINYTASNNFTLNNGTIFAEDDLHTFTGTMTIGAGGGTIYTQWQNVQFNTLTGAGNLAIDTQFTNATAPAGIVHLLGTGGYTGTLTINGLVPWGCWEPAMAAKYRLTRPTSCRMRRWS